MLRQGLSQVQQKVMHATRARGINKTCKNQRLLSLAGWYMTYISCQLMLFLSGYLLGNWLELQTSADSVLQHFRAPALFINDSRWHATVTSEYSVDVSSACPTILS